MPPYRVRAMKHSLIALTSALALGSTAFAGSEGYTGPAPTGGSSYQSSPLYQWFAGASVGYLTDSEEDYYTLHIGTKIAESGPISHSLYLEGGFTNFDESFVDIDIVPVTLNYKLDYQLSGPLSLYAGVGAGVAFVDVDTPFGGDDSAEFAWQAFAGIAYDLSPAAQIYGGARYIWIDDAKLFGSRVDVGDDVGVEIGARFRF